jgi:hypothetical protein
MVDIKDVLRDEEKVQRVQGYLETIGSLVRIGQQSHEAAITVLGDIVSLAAVALEEARDKDEPVHSG